MLQAAAAAGGTLDDAPDREAAEECLLWGWLIPQGGQGFALSHEGRAQLGDPAPGGEAAPSGAEHRAHPRQEVMRRGTVIHQPSGRTFSCVIVDISLGGARLQLYAPDLPRDELTLLDREKGTAHQLRVAWSLGPLVGVAFTSTEQLRSD